MVGQSCSEKRWRVWGWTVWGRWVTGLIHVSEILLDTCVENEGHTGSVFSGFQPGVLYDTVSKWCSLSWEPPTEWWAPRLRVIKLLNPCGQSFCGATELSLHDMQCPPWVGWVLEPHMANVVCGG